MKKEWVNPEIRFTTDSDIILGCLYEVYGQEKQVLRTGVDFRHTMIFPFLRMLSNNPEETTREMEILHKRFWKIYQEKLERQEFVRRGQKILMSTQKGERNG